jgi:hypothetical protein
MLNAALVLTRPKSNRTNNIVSALAENASACPERSRSDGTPFVLGRAGKITKEKGASPVDISTVLCAMLLTTPLRNLSTSQGFDYPTKFLSLFGCIELVKVMVDAGAKVL